MSGEEKSTTALDAAVAERRTRRRWAAGIVAVAVLVAGVRIATAALDDGPEAPPRPLAVLERPANAGDREAGVADFVDLGYEERRGGPASVHVVRRVFEQGDRSVVLIATAPHPDRGDPDREEVLCLYDVVRSTTGITSGGACGGLAKLRHGAIKGTHLQRSVTKGAREADGLKRDLKSGRGWGPAHFYGLVPDGVDRVEVTFSGGVPPVGAKVNDNFYDALSLHPHSTDRVGVTNWFDADGQPVPH